MAKICSSVGLSGDYCICDLGFLKQTKMNELLLLLYVRIVEKKKIICFVKEDVDSISVVYLHC